MAKMISRTLVLIAVVAIAFQVAPVTRLVFAPEDASFDGSHVTLLRRFPGDDLGFPRPRMSYVETVAPLTPGHNGGHVCQDAGGPFAYTRAQPLGQWDVAPWAADCLSDPYGVRWQAVWTWHLGNLRAGPVSLSAIFRKGVDYE
jgi:hypothetical protein